MFGHGAAVKPGSAYLEKCLVFIIDCQCEDDNIERWLPAGTSGDEKTIKLLNQQLTFGPN